MAKKAGKPITTKAGRTRVIERIRKDINANTLKLDKALVRGGGTTNFYAMVDEHVLIGAYIK